MTLAMAGGALLGASLVLAVLAFGLLVASAVLGRRTPEPVWAARLSAWGSGAFLLAFAALLLCAAVLAWAFLSGDVSIRYVVYYRSDSAAPLAWLYKLSGMWGGAEGSLLIWALMLAAFGCAPALRCVSAARFPGDGGRVRGNALDAAALAVLVAIMVVFLGYGLLFPSGQVFAPLDAQYLDASGNLAGEATLWGLSELLEHWAMAVHPPLLFVGYAGLTVPFAYALAALALGDGSSRWAGRVRVPLLVAWLFLSLGIGTGAAWAYAVLGWGGYWGWDAVENASLLPWLACVAFVHSLGLYRRTGAFHRWTLLCACLLFSLVGLDAFITRSGIIGSVHAFAGNDEAFALFGAMTVLPVGLGAVGVLARWRAFGPAPGATEAEEGRRGFSPEALCYLNNVAVMGFAAIVAYGTLAPALPSWMPLGGQVLSAQAYNSVAAPLTVAYLLLLAVCPLTGRGALRGRRGAVLATFATVCFALLAWYWAEVLVPTSVELAQQAAEGAPQPILGSIVYRNGLALAAFATAALLAGSAAASALRGLDRPAGGLRARLRLLGASASHGAMAFLLVGLVGSTLYVSDSTFFLTVDHQSGGPTGQTDPMELGGYALEYRGMRTVVMENRTDMLNTAFIEVFREGGADGADGVAARARSLGTMEPAMQVVATTRQTHYLSAVATMPLEDLFVVYKGAVPGVGEDDPTMELMVEVRINRLVLFVWAGFALFVLGCLLSIAGSLRPRRRPWSLKAPALPEPPAA
ncbi:cytochrome c biogenesis protein CcsA [Adlercreutzia aquisgranensis]|uniref:cytochrome c biogenesis protein CcsA n=1 Tax=Adlercreutzia aquisgranensis TaxID=2941323 RepID=UPI00203DC939|nr:cytochrome c biogenesis protein CcsA [Adlercreutzia aquisgranensis]